ncbi:MAG: hypothetical protein R2822_16520 [Spirosomataceae bacterium]
MKKLIFPILSGLVLSCTLSTAQDVKFKEQIHKEFVVSPQSVLAVYNLNGAIKIEGYDGNKLLIEVDKTISAKTTEQLEEGKQELKLEFDQRNDSVIVYISEPWDTRPHQKQDRWNNHKKIHYDHLLNFTIKIPKTLNLVVSTINKGDIEVENVSGLLKANNINGRITLKNVKGAHDVHTINGDVTINYTALPPNNAKYYTLNGNLNITYPANFSGDCEFKSFQGEFFTDFEQIEKLPAKTIKTTSEKNGATTYKLDKINTIRIGKGGNNFKFETFNGNIYIKKQS